MVTKVQIRSQFDLMNDLTSLIDDLRDCGISAEYYQLPDVSSTDEAIVPEEIKSK
ncbi:hypothetical protein ACOBV8_18735 (plasmid) [Pseudoalteromonas espejiana]